jgi:hypothetical protein
MWWVTLFLRWRWRQPPLIRWLEAAALFGIALAIRFSLGPLYGAIPFLSFYPAILVAAVLLGWKEAIFVLVLSLSAALYLLLPPGMLLLPAGWALVGVLNIAIIIALKALSQQLADANDGRECYSRNSSTASQTRCNLRSVNSRASGEP